MGDVHNNIADSIIEIAISSLYYTLASLINERFFVLVSCELILFARLPQCCCCCVADLRLQRIPVQQHTHTQHTEANRLQPVECVQHSCPATPSLGNMVDRLDIKPY